MTATATGPPEPSRAPPHDTANIVEVDDLKVYFPIRAGIFQQADRGRSRPSTA